MEGTHLFQAASAYVLSSELCAPTSTHSYPARCFRARLRMTACWCSAINAHLLMCCPLCHSAGVAGRTRGGLIWPLTTQLWWPHFFGSRCSPCPPLEPDLCWFLTTSYGAFRICYKLVRVASNSLCRCLRVVRGLATLVRFAYLGHRIAIASAPLSMSIQHDLCFLLHG